MLRFSCEKALLQSAVNTVSRAVAAKAPSLRWRAFWWRAATG